MGGCVIFCETGPVLPAFELVALSEFWGDNYVSGDIQARGEACRSITQCWRSGGVQSLPQLGMTRRNSARFPAYLCPRWACSYGSGLKNGMSSVVGESVAAGLQRRGSASKAPGNCCHFSYYCLRGVPGFHQFISIPPLWLTCNAFCICKPERTKTGIVQYALHCR